MSSTEKIKGLKEDQCVVDVLLKEVQSHPCKDCGKCVFGYEGITQLEMILKDITEKMGLDLNFSARVVRQIRHF